MQVMPEDAGYRIHVEKWFTYISKTCNEIEEVTNKSVYLVKVSIPASTNFNLRRTFEGTPSSLFNSDYFNLLYLPRT